jgi:hypothetical protein
MLNSRKAVFKSINYPDLSRLDIFFLFLFPQIFQDSTKSKILRQKVMDPTNNMTSTQTLDETAQGGYTCHKCCIWNSFVHKFCRECEHRICGVCILGPWGLGEGEDRVSWPRPQRTDRSLWPFLPFERERRPEENLGWRGARRLGTFAKKKSRR